MRLDHIAVGDLIAQLRLPSRAGEALREAAARSLSDENMRRRIEEVTCVLERRMGQDGEIDIPERPRLGGKDAVWDSGLVDVYAVLNAIPHMLEWHRARGVPEDISWSTLADLGIQLERYIRIHGVVGFDKLSWMSLHLRGLLYTVGRLQFEIGRLPLVMERAVELGEISKSTCSLLHVHIPEGAPLDPTSCEESFGRAKVFFETSFPMIRSDVGVCESWLLDDQLKEYLPPGSNILAFQNRFRLGPGWTDDDTSIVRYVFRWRGISAGLHEIAPQTCLERAVLAHLDAGRHWRVRWGWTILGDERVR